MCQQDICWLVFLEFKVATGGKNGRLSKHFRFSGRTKKNAVSDSTEKTNLEIFPSTTMYQHFWIQGRYVYSIQVRIVPLILNCSIVIIRRIKMGCGQTYLILYLSQAPQVMPVEKISAMWRNFSTWKKCGGKSVWSRFMLFCFKICFVTIYAVLSRNL